MTPRFVYGTAGLHRIAWGPARRRLLRLAWDTGFRAFDTAPLYGNGLSEREIGRAFGDLRSQVSITTKFGIPVSLYGAARPWTFTGERVLRMALDPGYRASFNMRDWRAARMRADLEGSLKRLQMDRVDRFCLHEPLDVIPMSVWDDLCAEAQILKQQGKIGQFGISGERSCMAELAARPGLDFVQTRICVARGLGAFSGPVFAYGIYGAFGASGETDFNAFVRRRLDGSGIACLLLSSTNPQAVAAYKPLFG